MKKSNVISIVGLILCVLVGGVLATQVAGSQSTSSSVEIGLLHLAVNGEERGYALPASGHSASGCTTNKLGETTCPPPPAPTCVSNQGASCQSGANSCGMRNTGSVQCNGSCSASTPSNASCPVVPTCAANQGNFCLSGANSCGARNSGTIQCNGSCSATTPSNASCPVTPTCVSNQGTSCQSGANSCGMRNTGSVQCNGSCSATTPSNASCPVAPSSSFSAPSSCTIPVGGSSCSININWNLTGQTSPNIRNQTTGSTLYTTATGSNRPVNLSYRSTPTRLVARAGNSVLVTRNVATNCAAGSTWNSTLSECVIPPEVSINIDAPGTTYVGQVIEIEWTTDNVTTCTASGAWSGSKATNGTFDEDVTITASGTQTFRLDCNGPGGPGDDSATINAAEPTLSLDVNRTVVRSGDSVVVDWSVAPWTGVDPTASCQINGLQATPYTVTAASGSQTSSAITNGRRIILSCTIFGNTYTEDVFIEVIPSVFEN